MVIIHNIQSGIFNDGPQGIVYHNKKKKFKTNTFPID